MIIYNMQFYIDDMRRLCKENNTVYLKELNYLSMIELEKELKRLTGKTYYELTGNHVGF